MSFVGTKHSRGKDKNPFLVRQRQTLFSFGVTSLRRENINAAMILLPLLNLPKCVRLW